MSVGGIDPGAAFSAEQHHGPPPRRAHVVAQVAARHARDERMHRPTPTGDGRTELAVVQGKALEAAGDEPVRAHEVEQFRDEATGEALGLAITKPDRHSIGHDAGVALHQPGEAGHQLVEYLLQRAAIGAQLSGHDHPPRCTQVRCRNHYEAVGSATCGADRRSGTSTLTRSSATVTGNMRTRALKVVNTVCP
jgi:hypothetical protein